MPRKRKGLPINGILLLNKPLGLSSNKALQKAKHLFTAQKAGHTGSLDPLATGMLPICFGEATKVCAHLLDSNKAYAAEITLGIKTSTEDGEGEIIHQQAVPEFTKAQIEDVLAQFRGEIEQVPPMHSALWHEGKRLYEIARAGETVDVKARNVTIHNLQTVSAINNNKLNIEVSCSKGTYIRSLVRDIGDVLACGAYMSALHRQYVEPFDGYPLYEWDTLASDNIDLQGTLLPVDSALQQYATAVLTEQQAEDMFLGRKVQLDTVQQTEQNTDFSIRQTVRIYKKHVNSDDFLGLANSEGAGLISPKRLMHL